MLTFIGKLNARVKSVDTLNRWTSIAVMGTCAVVGFTALIRFSSFRALRQHARIQRKRASSVGTGRLMVSKTTAEYIDFDPIINVLTGFDSPLDVAQLKFVFADKMLKYRNFRCVPEQTKVGGPVIWRPVAYNPENHFFFHTVKDVDDLKEQVRTEANDMLKFRQRKDVPWWELHLYGTEAGKYTYLLIRAHHAIGDGLSLSEASCDVFQKADGSAMTLTETFASKIIEYILARQTWQARLRRVVHWPVDFLQGIVDGVAVFGWVLWGRDTSTMFHRCDASRYTDKVPVYLPSHSLALVRKIKDRLNAQLKSKSPFTFNDIESSLFSGMIHRYLKAHGESAEGTLTRTLTPYGLPEIADPETRYETMLRNHWTFVSTKLPVDEKTALDRIKASNKYWSYTKSSMIVPMAFLIHRMITRWGTLKMQRFVPAGLNKRHTVCFSNVPGPAEDVYIAGTKANSVHMVLANYPVQVGVLSMAGYVYFVFCDDGPASAEREAEFGRHFTDELVELAGAVGIDKGEVLSELRPPLAGF